MGLNFEKRPPREDLDPPNDFVSVGLGQTDFEWKENDEEIIYDFYNDILDGIQEKYQNLEF